jgi:hypothetical protein
VGVVTGSSVGGANVQRRAGDQVYDTEP